MSQLDEPQLITTHNIDDSLVLRGNDQVQPVVTVKGPVVGFEVDRRETRRLLRQRCFQNDKDKNK